MGVTRKCTFRPRRKLSGRQEGEGIARQRCTPVVGEKSYVEDMTPSMRMDYWATGPGLADCSLISDIRKWFDGRTARME